MLIHGDIIYSALKLQMIADEEKRLIKEILQIAKVIAEKTRKDIDEEKIKAELWKKTIPELRNILEKFKKQEASINQQETKTTDKGREPGE